MGLDVSKPVLGVSDKVRFKPVSSATEINQKIEILLVASLDMILSNKQTTKALIRQRGCAGWSAPLLFGNPRRQVFSRRGPYYFCYKTEHYCLTLLRPTKFTIKFDTVTGWSIVNGYNFQKI